MHTESITPSNLSGLSGWGRAVSSPFPFPRLYRAHVQPADYRGTERTAFVEAASHRDATRRIANAVAALEGCLPDTVLENRLYNCYSARELIFSAQAKPGSMAM